MNAVAAFLACLALRALIELIFDRKSAFSQAVIRVLGRTLSAPKQTTELGQANPSVASEKSRRSKSRRTKAKAPEAALPEHAEPSNKAWQPYRGPAAGNPLPADRSIDSDDSSAL